MCSSGVGFDPVVNGTHYTFDVFGLYEGLFVMDDRQTGSVWTHFDGTVLQGPLAGRDLAMTIVPLAHTTWESWLADHPDTLVLDWFEEHSARYRRIDPGRAGLTWIFEKSLSGTDDRLEANRLVLGAGVGDDFRAYPLDENEELRVLDDELGGHPVVVVLDGTEDFGLAWSAVVNGEARAFSVDDGVLVDDRGTRWDMTGRGVDGPDEGEQLEFVTSFVTEWYGWAAYHPTTEIHGRGS